MSASNPRPARTRDQRIMSPVPAAGAMCCALKVLPKRSKRGRRGLLHHVLGRAGTIICSCIFKSWRGYLLPLTCGGRSRIRTWVGIRRRTYTLRFRYRFASSSRKVPSTDAQKRKRRRQVAVAGSAVVAGTVVAQQGTKPFRTRGEQLDRAGKQCEASTDPPRSGRLQITETLRRSAASHQRSPITAGRGVNL